jgi:hypothetical protein
MKQVVIGEFNGGGTMPFYAEGVPELDDQGVIRTNKGKLKVIRIIQIDNISMKIIKKTTKSIIQILDKELLNKKII